MRNGDFDFIDSKDFRNIDNISDNKNLAVRKGFIENNIKAIDEEKRTIDFVISSEAVDRMFDVIFLNGWDLKNFKNNPVVLFAHDRHVPPIAKASKLKKDKENGLLLATAEFMPRDLSEFADSIFNMLVAGFLKATSVGFLPIKVERADDEDRPFGLDFIKQELLEFSVVPVPANPEALITGKSHSINVRPLHDWASKLLDVWDDDVKQDMKRVDVEDLFNKTRVKKKTIYRVSMAKKVALRKENLKRLAELNIDEDTDVDVSNDTENKREWKDIQEVYAFAARIPQIGVMENSSKDDIKADLDKVTAACEEFKSEAPFRSADWGQYDSLCSKLAKNSAIDDKGNLKEGSVCRGDVGIAAYFCEILFGDIVKDVFFDVDDAPWKKDQDLWGRYLEAYYDDDTDAMKDIGDKLFDTQDADVITEEIQDADIEETVVIEEGINEDEDDVEVKDDDTVPSLDVDVEELDMKKKAELHFKLFMQSMDAIADVIEEGELKDFVNVRSNKRLVREVLLTLHDLVGLMMKTFEVDLDGMQEIADKDVTEDTDVADDEISMLQLEDDDINEDDFDISDDEVMGAIKEILPTLISELVTSQLNKETGKLD